MWFRLLPPLTFSQCSTCGRQLRERKRKPCPTCKGTSRTIFATANDSIAAIDKAN